MMHPIGQPQCDKLVDLTLGSANVVCEVHQLDIRADVKPQRCLAN
jgi:hypothetical protein